MSGSVAKRCAFILALTFGMPGFSQAQQPVDERAAQAACQDDAFKFCQVHIPDRDRTLACLIQAKDGLSGACRTVLASSGLFPPDPPAKKKSGNTQQRAKRAPVDLNPTASR